MISAKKIRQMKIKIEAEIAPVPFNRPRFGKGKVVFNSPRYSAFKAELGYKARSAMNGKKIVTGAFKISVDIYKKSAQNLLSKNFGDLDNFVKAVMDALNGICFVDDAQCVEFKRCRKFKSDKPKIVIQIEEVKS